MEYVSGGVVGEGGEWMRGFSFGFTNPVGTGGVLDVRRCLGCNGVGGVSREWVGLGPGSGGGVVFCLCESGFSV